MYHQALKDKRDGIGILCCLYNAQGSCHANTACNYSMQRPSSKPVQQASPLPLQLQPPPQAAAQRLPSAAAAPLPAQQPALATRQSAASQRPAEPGVAQALAQPQGLVRSPLQQYPSPTATHEQVPRQPTQRWGTVAVGLQCKEHRHVTD
jgi:hypothetical protein